MDAQLHSRFPLVTVAALLSGSTCLRGHHTPFRTPGKWLDIGCSTDMLRILT
jgi:hypothetical protein